MLASSLHLLFEFLAFQSDIAFWSGNKSLAGGTVHPLVSYSHLSCSPIAIVAIDALPSMQPYPNQSSISSPSSSSSSSFPVYHLNHHYYQVSRYDPWLSSFSRKSLCSSSSLIQIPPCWSPYRPFVLSLFKCGKYKKPWV